jgi:hypothetical protein
MGAAMDIENDADCEADLVLPNKRTAASDLEVVIGAATIHVPIDIVIVPHWTRSLPCFGYDNLVSLLGSSRFQPLKKSWQRLKKPARRKSLAATIMVGFCGLTCEALLVENSHYL